MHSMSIAALFTIVKIWKSFKCPLIYKWRKTLWYIYVYVHTHIICRDIHIYMEYYSAIKIVKCCNLQQHGWTLKTEHYAKWNQSDRERQKLYYHSYVESKKKNNKASKTKNKLIDTESRLMAVSGRDLKVEDMRKEGQNVKRYKKF